MRFWPFGRRKPVQPPLPDGRQLSEDWKAGDLAICAIGPYGGWPAQNPFDPKDGDVLRVTRVRDEIGFNGFYQYRGIFLGFEGKPQDHAWDNRNFRKADVRHEPATKTVEEMIRDAEQMPVKADG